MEIKHKTRDKQSKPVKLVVLLVVLALVLTGLGFLGREAYLYYKDANVLVKHAEDLKAELKTVVDHIEKGDYEAATLSIQKIDTLSAEMRAVITEERWKTVQDKTPKYGNDLKTAQQLLDVVDEASNTLLKPGVQFLKEKGLPNKATFTKINSELGTKLNDYAALIDELCPAAEKVLNDFNAIPQFEYKKLESKVSKYRVLAKENSPEIITYLHFAQETSDKFIKPAAKFLTEKGSSLKFDFDMDKVGPEMAVQLTAVADGIDQFVPIGEDLLKEINTLPEFKIEKVEAKISKYRKLAKDNEADLISLMQFAKEMSSGVIRPTATVMSRSPMSGLKTENGDIDTKIIRDYLSLVNTVRPYLGKINDVLKTNNLLKNYSKKLSKITSKLDAANELLVEYDKYVPYIDLLLGDGSDKRYIIVAQNSAEMRAAGGLPASIGTVTITDGILHIGKFEACLKVIPYKNRGVNTSFSKVELAMFSEDWYGKKLTAATVNPHFPRAAQLIARGYKKKNKKAVNGIISMTPAIVGRLINITGPITLSNGVKLDEKYAVRYLQRDVYFQYFTKSSMKSTKAHNKANTKTNELFAEAAKKVISGVMSNLNVKTIMKLLEIVKTSSDDRVFMMWMANAQEEETVKSLGSSGALNYDPQNPEIGIFVNIKDANRLGNYVDLNVSLGQETVNKDGSVTYPVTVKFKNNIDKTTLKKGKYSAYLTSRHGGDMRPILYFFAPAGGKITKFKNNCKLTTKKATYQKLKVYYCPVFTLKPRKTVTFTFKITTAPGVTAKPKIVTTPLLSEYRNATPPQ